MCYMGAYLGVGTCLGHYGNFKAIVVKFAKFSLADDVYKLCFPSATPFNHT